MENRRVLKKEGLNLTIDKEVLDDQRVLEVSTEVPDKAKVEKEDKDDFENYKVLYKGAIDDRCLEEYGTCDDEKLWEDTAKEMFLKAVNYIPEEDKKADGELVDREEEQEPTLVRENRSVIQHNKVVENKKIKKLNEALDDEELNDIYNYLLEMQDNIDTLYANWTFISPEVRDKLDNLFTEGHTISYCLRWAEQAVHDLISDWDQTKQDLNGEELNESRTLKEDQSQAKEMGFSSLEFEKLIPHVMRWKEWSVVNDKDLYWITQQFFKESDVKEFAEAFKNTGFEKAFVTVRDLSTYEYDKDLANNVLVVVNNDGTYDMTNYLDTCRKTGYDETLYESKDNKDIKECPKQD